MKLSFLLFLLLIIVIVLFSNDGLIKTKASNNKIYYTQKHKSEEAANILSNVDKFKDKLIKVLVKDNPDNIKIQKLMKKKINIKEIPKMHNYIAYTLNKNTLYICLRKNKDKFETNMNALYFVVMHELAHVISSTIGHTPEFWNNYKLILKTSIKNKLYNYKNYYVNPITYCNKKIYSTPYVK